MTWFDCAPVLRAIALGSVLAATPVSLRADDPIAPFGDALGVVIYAYQTAR